MAARYRREQVQLCFFCTPATMSADVLPMTHEQRRTKHVRDMGRENGLFRACMDEIKSSHSRGQNLRNAMLAAGLLTDAKCYAELLGQFYLATRALESRLQSQSSGLAATLYKKLQYQFTAGYEADLAHLLGASEWAVETEEMATPPARAYVKRIQAADDETLCAAIMILWGPMAIGGGALIMPRVKAQFGQGATHVFRSVVGDAGGGRAARRTAFIEAFDTLTDDKQQQARITRAAGALMTLNNEMMLAVQRSPWWSKYVKVGAAAVVLLAARWAWKSFQKD